MGRRIAIIGFVTLALLGPSRAHAGLWPSADYEFDVVPSVSEISVSVTALGLSDSDSSPADGTIHATLAPASGDFTTIRITGLDIDLTETLTLELDGSFLGGVDISATNVGVRLDDLAGAAGPAAAVDVAGDFVQGGNWVLGVGTIDYAGYGLLGAGLGSGTINIADLGEQPTDFVGNVGLNALGGLVLLAFDLDLQTQYTDLATGVTVDVVITGQLWARAVTLRFADADDDGDVDAEDANRFFETAGGPNQPPLPSPHLTEAAALAAFDCDTDADLDLRDYAAVQAAATGDLAP